MRVDVYPVLNHMDTIDFRNKTAIVVDVLRSTSSIVTAMQYGSLGVIPVDSINRAKEAAVPGDLLGGERNGRKIAGFHLGNSPLEYMQSQVKGNRIIMTTTNGTLAIQQAKKADLVLAGSLLNSAACSKAALENGRDIVIVCAGTVGEFSLEDGLCAGLLLQDMMDIIHAPIEMNDFGSAMNSAYLSRSDCLEQQLLRCSNGLKLIKLGYRPDVIFCSQTSVYTAVPTLQEGAMVLNRHASHTIN